MLDAYTAENYFAQKKNQGLKSNLCQMWRMLEKVHIFWSENYLIVGDVQNLKIWHVAKCIAIQIYCNNLLFPLFPSEVLSCRHVPEQVNNHNEGQGVPWEKLPLATQSPSSLYRHN